MSLAIRKEYIFDESEGEVTADEFVDFLDLPENKSKSYLLVDGYIVMMAGNANINHHRISSYIAREIGNYLKGKPCEVFQDMNVYLFQESIGNCKNVFQPDLIVGCDREKMVLRGYEGPPELIVEVTSKSTANYDYLVKTLHYMRAGVKEYWIVDLDRNQIVVYLNGGEEAPIIRSYTFEDTISIGIFGDFSIDFKEILEIVDLSLK